MRSRLARLLVVAAAAAALAAAGIAVNFLLLRYAESRNDPVGKLTPRATITQPTPPATTHAHGGSHHHGDIEGRDD